METVDSFHMFENCAVGLVFLRENKHVNECKSLIWRAATWVIHRIWNIFIAQALNLYEISKSGQ